MTDPSFSFVYDRKPADAAFPGIAVSDLVLSLLAGLTPEAEWEGCRVFGGESPLGADTVCVGTTGPGENLLQLQLLSAFERQGIGAIEVYEGGPEVRSAIATAGIGRWVSPSR